MPRFKGIFFFLQPLKCSTTFKFGLKCLFQVQPQAPIESFHFHKTAQFHVLILSIEIIAATKDQNPFGSIQSVVVFLSPTTMLDRNH